MEKKRVPESGQVLGVRTPSPAHFDFQPAQLRIHEEKWRIEYWVRDPATGEMTRYRPTFNLNRIIDERERRKHAARIIRKLNDVWLPGGYPFRTPEQIEGRGTTIGDAFGAILKIKVSAEKEDTRSCYRSIGGVFTRWMVARGLDRLDAKAFAARHALDYADFLILEREIGNKHFNNTVNTLAGIWKVLIKREIVDRNPWGAVPRRKTAPKQRRMFSPEERRFIAQWAHDNDFWLFLGILFEYYGFIRWKEMRRLRFGDVVIGGDTAHVRLAAEKTKNGNARTVTMPDSIRHYLADPRFSGQPANYFIFGKNWQPGPVQGWVNGLNEHHRKAIEAGVAAGAIADRAGLSMYSWKDTGITIGLDVADNFMDVVDQADHRDPRQTMTYKHAPKINPSFKKRPHDIFA